MSTSFDELKTKSQEALKQQAVLLKLYVIMMITIVITMMITIMITIMITTRKEEELQASQKQQELLRKVTDEMKQSLRTVTTERESLSNEVLRTQQQLSALKKAQSIASQTYSSPSSETRAILKELHTTPESVEEDLRKRGLGVADLYAQLTEREKETSKLREEKQRVET